MHFEVVLLRAVTLDWLVMDLNVLGFYFSMLGWQRLSILIDLGY
jgi:hypothetical protein